EIRTAAVRTKPKAMMSHSEKSTRPSRMGAVKKSVTAPTTLSLTVKNRSIASMENRNAPRLRTRKPQQEMTLLYRRTTTRDQARFVSRKTANRVDSALAVPKMANTAYAL